MSDKNSNPILMAFEQERRPGFYNVWRYDKGATHNILWGAKAVSTIEAINRAKQHLSETVGE